ncbi:MAG: ABC transporter permease [Cytophagales bacterium]|nr:ABC transporter permease [Cytophagales bacterium]
MRKEIGKYLLDVSKLVFGGVVLSTILKIEDFSKLKLFVWGMTATFIIALLGFIFINKK